MLANPYREQRPSSIIRLANKAVARIFARCICNVGDIAFAAEILYNFGWFEWDQAPTVFDLDLGKGIIQLRADIISSKTDTYLPVTDRVSAKTKIAWCPGGLAHGSKIGCLVHTAIMFHKCSIYAHHKNASQYGGKGACRLRPGKNLAGERKPAQPAPHASHFHCFAYLWEDAKGTCNIEVSPEYIPSDP